MVLIGGPMCTVHSAMNNINHAQMAPEVARARFEHARKHLEFATTLYKLQIQGGRHLLHEHPQSASSWEETRIREALNMKNVSRVVAGQCQHGLKSSGPDGPGPARKTTGFTTNPPCIALQFQRRCPNSQGYQVHKHGQFEGGRVRAAQVNPPELCKAVCRGIITQIELDRNGQFVFMHIGGNDDWSSRDLMHAANATHSTYEAIEEESSGELEVAWDDAFGATLYPQSARNASEEEIQYVRKMDLYQKVFIAECTTKREKHIIQAG